MKTEALVCTIYVMMRCTCIVTSMLNYCCTVNPGYNGPFYTLANGSLHPGIRCKGRYFTWIHLGGAHHEGSLNPRFRCIRFRCILGSLYWYYRTCLFTCLDKSIQEQFIVSVCFKRDAYTPVNLSSKLSVLRILWPWKYSLF